MLIERESFLDIHAPHDGEAGAIDRVCARAAPAMEQIPGFRLEHGVDVNDLRIGILANALETSSAVESSLEPGAGRPFR